MERDRGDFVEQARWRDRLAHWRAAGGWGRGGLRAAGGRVVAVRRNLQVVLVAVRHGQSRLGDVFVLVKRVPSRDMDAHGEVRRRRSAPGREDEGDREPKQG
jgi:hypothetical protein